MKKDTQRKGPTPKRQGRGQPSPYPFKSWDVGDTTRFPIGDYQKIRHAVGNLNRDKNWHFIYEKTRELGREYVRVWRES